MVKDTQKETDNFFSINYSERVRRENKTKKKQAIFSDYVLCPVGLL